MYQTKFFNLRPLRLIALSCGLLLHGSLGAISTFDEALSTTLNNLTNAFNSLASAPTINASSMGSLIYSSALLADKVSKVSFNSGTSTIVNSLSSINNSIKSLQTASQNSTFILSNEDIIVSSLLSISNTFNTIVNTNNFSDQSDINIAAITSINIVALLDFLATSWNGNVTSVQNTAYDALADYSTLTNGIYSYNTGTASIAKIKTANTAIADYVTKLITLKSFTEYVLPRKGCLPQDICPGLDGNIWFCQFSDKNPRVGKITPNGTITEFATTTAPYNICMAPDGNIWFSGGSLGKITPNGTVTENKSLTPYDICVGPDNNIWAAGNGGVRKINITSSDAITFYQINNLGDGGCVCAGPDGNLWISAANTVIKMNPANGTILNSYEKPTKNGGAGRICPGPDGNLWFTQFDKSKVVRVTTSGVFSEFNVGSGPYDIYAGPDGNVWFSEYYDNTIKKINTSSGAITAYTIPTIYSGPTGICLGPDGNIWFCQQDGNKVAKIKLNWKL